MLLSQGIGLDTTLDGDVEQHMRDRNCVFIGSPKYNEFCDGALTKLLADGSQPPFQFMWSDAPGRRSPLFAKGPSLGLHVRVPDSSTSEQLPLTLNEPATAVLKADLPIDKRIGWDYGVFVICRQPFGTKHEVTSVFLCGFSGYATEQLAHELAQGLLFLHPSEIKKNKPLWRILRCPWKLQGRTPIRHSDGRRWINPDKTEAVLDAAKKSGEPPPSKQKEPETVEE